VKPTGICQRKQITSCDDVNCRNNEVCNPNDFSCNAIPGCDDNNASTEESVDLAVFPLQCTYTDVICAAGEVCDPSSGMPSTTCISSINCIRDKQTYYSLFFCTFLTPRLC